MSPTGTFPSALSVPPRPQQPLPHHPHAPARRARARSARLYAVGGEFAGVVKPLCGMVVLHRCVTPACHLLTRPPAWAVDTGVLDRAQELGARFVVNQERWGRRYWVAPLAWFWSYGVHVDRGCGRQRGLPLRRWREGEHLAGLLAVAELDTGGDTLTAPRTQVTAAAEHAQQLPLFP